VARKRLAAIKEFSDLGSGFRVAALDLEIRGAGNLLGGEQSGHIDAVGFEMYMKLLEDTVRELKGEELEEDVRATVNLRVDLKIDDSYIPDMNQRLMVYRKPPAAGPSWRRRWRRSAIATARRPIPSSTWPSTAGSASWPTSWAWTPSTATAVWSSLSSGPRPGWTRSAW
jgi:transcription-repair coupling factor (superfamily II helicase)